MGRWRALPDLADGAVKGVAEAVDRPDPVRSVRGLSNGPPDGVHEDSETPLGHDDVGPDGLLDLGLRNRVRARCGR